LHIQLHYRTTQPISTKFPFVEVSAASIIQEWDFPINIHGDNGSFIYFQKTLEFALNCLEKNFTLAQRRLFDVLIYDINSSQRAIRDCHTHAEASIFLLMQELTISKAFQH